MVYLYLWCAVVLCSGEIMCVGWRGMVHGWHANTTLQARNFFLRRLVLCCLWRETIIIIINSDYCIIFSKTFIHLFRDSTATASIFYLTRVLWRTLCVCLLTWYGFIFLVISTYDDEGAPVLFFFPSFRIFFLLFFAPFHLHSVVYLTSMLSAFENRIN